MHERYMRVQIEQLQSEATRLRRTVCERDAEIAILKRQIEQLQNQLTWTVSRNQERIK
ncbi:MAG: hypothetical protein GY700_01655 [Propionibacteriaceae bacterium]|nr:hypothetical protein [Propionibacteriaceae bacterium]